MTGCCRIPRLPLIVRQPADAVRAVPIFRHEPVSAYARIHRRQGLARRAQRARLGARLPIRVKAPTCVDVTLRRKEARTLIHLVNRASGIPNRPDDGTVDEIPCVGPIHVEIDMPAAPRHVSLAWEDSPMRYRFRKSAREGLARRAQHTDCSTGSREHPYRGRDRGSWDEGGPPAGGS